MKEWLDLTVISKWVAFDIESFAILGIDPAYVHFLLSFFLIAAGVWLFEPVMLWMINANWKRLLTFLVISLAVTNLLISIQLYQVAKMNINIAEEALAYQLLAVLSFGACYTLYGLVRQIFRYFSKSSKPAVKRW
ncbi:hypothetical protein [Thalassobacillus devorans]|uniref:hypothetical protein n=1 Tax=Thalassobacillus devorans TaxID=279813 RepID=UPI00048A4F10|nr:hypothetical protein [Thalassobacillus devorans]